MTSYEIMEKDIGSIVNSPAFANGLLGNNNSTAVPLECDLKRCVFLINGINYEKDIKKRNGAEEDRKGLINLFKTLGYTIFCFEDLTGKQFFKLIELIINSDFLAGIETFMLFISSHGHTKDGGVTQVVQFKDGATVNTDEIIQLFSGNSCELLGGKQKILIFNCCRAKIEDRMPEIWVDCVDSAPQHLSDGEHISLTNFISCGDSTPTNTRNTLVVYSADLGQYSFRDDEFGSVFVMAFCLCVSAMAWKTDFEKIMKFVSRNVPMLIREIKIDGKRISDELEQTPVVENLEFEKLCHSQPKECKWEEKTY